MLDGVDVLANAVKATLGPKGRTLSSINLLGRREYKRRRHSGKEIELNEKFENMGAQMARGGIKANDNAGDGTTTATVLAQSIVKAQSSGAGITQWI